MDKYALFFRKHTLYKAKEFHLSWIISFIGGQPVLEGCLHWRYNYLQTLGSKSAKHLIVSITNGESIHEGGTSSMQ